MFKLSKEEFGACAMRPAHSPSTAWQCCPPYYAATERLKSTSPIVRTFVKLRRILASNEDLARKVAQHDRQISALLEHVRKMLAPVPVKKNPIGFLPPKDC